MRLLGIRTLVPSRFLTTLILYAGRILYWNAGFTAFQGANITKSSFDEGGMQREPPPCICSYIVNEQ